MVCPFLSTNGSVHQKPGRRTVPTYVPKNRTTFVWPGCTIISEELTSERTTIGAMITAES
jgi:hypothetical protein